MKNIAIKRLATLSAALLLSSTIAAFAQKPASDDDKKFVEAALKGGMGEVELGQLAAKKGNSADVKSFGQKMVTDHTRMGNSMKTVAGQVGVSAPSMAAADAIAEKAKLEALSGDAFDKEYIANMVKDHEEDLADFKKEATTGTSMEVKKAARDGAMVVNHHLTMIKNIAKAHNVSAS